MVICVHGCFCPWLFLSMVISVHGCFCPWLFPSMVVSVCGRFCLWLFLSMVISVHGYFCPWLFLSVVVFVCGCFCPWLFLSMVISVRSCFCLWLFLSMVVSVHGCFCPWSLCSWLHPSMVASIICFNSKKIPKPFLSPLTQQAGVTWCLAPFKMKWPVIFFPYSNYAGGTAFLQWWLYWNCHSCLVAAQTAPVKGRSTGLAACDMCCWEPGLTFWRWDPHVMCSDVGIKL